MGFWTDLALWKLEEMVDRMEKEKVKWI